MGALVAGCGTRGVPSEDAGPPAAIPGVWLHASVRTLDGDAGHSGQVTLLDAGGRDAQAEAEKPPLPQENDNTVRPNPPTDASANRFLASILRELDKAPPASWTRITGLSEVDRSELGYVVNWDHRLFRAGLAPYEAQPEAVVSVHFDPDLLRQEYETAGMRLAVVETRGSALIQVLSADASRLLGLKPPDRLQAISRIGTTLLDVRGPWLSRTPSSAHEAAAYSTAPDRWTMGMNAWDDRVDAGIYRGQLYYLCYKRISQMFGFPSSDGWLAKALPNRRGPAPR